MQATMTADKTQATEHGIEKQSVKPGDKPPAGTPITEKSDNAVQQRLQQREALSAYRLTKDPNNAFSIDMGNGAEVKDKRPLLSSESGSSGLAGMAAEMGASESKVQDIIKGNVWLAQSPSDSNAMQHKVHDGEQIADKSKEPEFGIRSGPFKGKEKEELAKTTAADKQSWEHAHDAFPQLANVPPNLMKAYTLNEIKFYHTDDQIQDQLAKNGIDGGWTLGIAQITTKGVREFEAKYPQLKEFLLKHGYGPGQEMKALLDPACVPMIVAAKTASIIEDLNRHHIPITTETVAYGYNPDVYSYSKPGGGRTYVALYGRHVEESHKNHPDQKKEYYSNKPEVIHASKHIKNVLSCLDEVQNN
jgi:hypothetical protein